MWRFFEVGSRGGNRFPARLPPFKPLMNPKRPDAGAPVTKIILLFLLVLAAIQIIKPLGWPGLEKRSDAWKLALGGLIVLAAAVGLIALFQ